MLLTNIYCFFLSGHFELEFFHKKKKKKKNNFHANFYENNSMYLFDQR